MKIAYIAHPISGNVDGNLKKLGAIIRNINLTTENIVPFAPYVSDLICMEDAVPSERDRGFKNNTAYFEKGLIDELWVYGDKISAGVQHEIDLAKRYFIPIIYKNDKLVHRA